MADLSDSTPTGLTRHVVRGEVVAEFAALAIAGYEGDSGCYLFYCDEDWHVVTDTFHPTLEGAISQAEAEFGRLSFTAPHVHSPTSAARLLRVVIEMWEDARERLRAGGVLFEITRDDRDPKPGVRIDASSDRGLAQISTWVTGEPTSSSVVCRQATSS